MLTEDDLNQPFDTALQWLLDVPARATHALQLFRNSQGSLPKPATLRDLRDNYHDEWLRRNVLGLGRAGVQALRAELGYPNKPIPRYPPTMNGLGGPINDSVSRESELWQRRIAALATLRSVPCPYCNVLALLEPIQYSGSTNDRRYRLVDSDGEVHACRTGN